MANELNNPDKLIERILADAQAEADELRAQAQEDVRKVNELSENEAWELSSDAAMRAKKQREDILERSRTNAELDSRKYALFARRRVVDEAFAAAEQRLNALSGAELDALLVSIAVRESDGGEALLPAPADEKAFSRLLPEINKALASSGKKPLTLGAATDGIARGFMLQAAGYEKNCSFAAALHEVHEYDSSRVAALLFN